MIALRFAAALLTSIAVCKAQDSMYIPGFDAQPLSINVLGVGSDGRTTFEILPGEPTGTWIGQDPAFVGTATLVEGPDDAYLTYEYPPAQISFAETCTFASGIANCVLQDMSVTVTMADPIVSMVVQDGTDLAMTSSPSASATGSYPSGFISTTSPSRSTTYGGSSALGPSSTSASGTQSNGSVGKINYASAYVLGFAGVALGLIL